jgi:hypothetical protein
MPETLRGNLKHMTRPASHVSPVVPATDTKARDCGAWLADARHVGWKVVPRPDRTSRRRGDASARRRAPIPPGNIGIEKATSARLASVMLSAPHKRSIGTPQSMDPESTSYTSPRRHGRARFPQ